MNFLFIQTINKSVTQYVKVKFEDVLYFKAAGDYTEIHTTKKRYLIFGGVKRCVGKAHCMIQCHRGYAVNPETISVIDNQGAHIGEIIIPIGREYRIEFLSKLHIIDNKK